MTKQSSGTLRVIGIGAAIGYCASRAMDLATDWYSEHQSEASKWREEEIASGGTLVLAGRWLAGMLGRDVTDEEAERIGWVIHRVLGVNDPADPLGLFVGDVAPEHPGEPPAGQHQGTAGGDLLLAPLGRLALVLRVPI